MGLDYIIKLMSSMQRYQEIYNFMNSYLDVITNAFNSESKGKNLQYELSFIGTLFSNLSNANLKSVSYPITNVCNSFNSINQYNTSGLSYIKSDTNYIAMYFQHDAVKEIYDELVKVLTDDNYQITSAIVNRKFNLDKYLDQFSNLSDSSIVVNQIVPAFQNVSINKVLMRIYAIYDENYQEHIETNREFEKLVRLYEDFICRHNIQSYSIYYYKNPNAQQVNYYSYIVSPHVRDTRFTFELYQELYGLLSGYLTNLINIKKLKEKVSSLTVPNKKPNQIETEQDKHVKIVKTKKPKEPIQPDQPAQSVQADEEPEKETKEKKPKKKPIPVALKRNVWNKWIGEAIGKSKCMCCKLTEITMLNFACGHIVAEANGGELKLDNLKPICVSCNSSMGTQNMNTYIEKYGL